MKAATYTAIIIITALITGVSINIFNSLSKEKLDTNDTIKCYTIEELTEQALSFDTLNLTTPVFIDSYSTGDSILYVRATSNDPDSIPGYIGRKQVPMTVPKNISFFLLWLSQQKDTIQEQE